MFLQEPVQGLNLNRRSISGLEPKMPVAVSQTHHVCTICTLTAILQLQFMLHVMLFPMLNILYSYISTSRSVCAVPNMADFCSALISCFPVMLLRYFLNNFEIVPVHSIVTGIILVFTFHMRCISNVKSLCLKIF
jgi:hypothetical protein